MEDYKENLEAAKKWMKIAKENKNEIAIQILENLFPELKESEDEKIRMSLIKFLCKLLNLKSTPDDLKDEIYGWIAWLEKQCGQKPIDKLEPKFKVGDWIINNDKRIAIPTQILKIEEYGYVTSRGYTSFDKVKTDYHLWTIQDAKDGDILMANAPFIFNGNLEGGIGCPGAHCGINTSGKFQIPKYPENWTGHTTTPAKKEQRDLLFQKMKEAGYEWDAENKELNKIVQRPDYSYCQKNCKGFRDSGKCFADWDCKDKREAEQKPAWSEEDEYQINTILHGLDLKREIYKKEGNKAEEERYNTQYNWLKSIKNRVQPQPKQEWSEEDEKWLKETISIITQYDSICRKEGDRCYTANTVINWLESLKPHWKPSEEQIKSLRVALQTMPYSKEKENVLVILEELEKL